MTDGIHNELEADLQRKNENEPPDSNRRELLAKAGKLGVSATLAHFLLLGGREQKSVLALDDSCPTYISSDDNCNPDPANWDKDLCNPATTDPWFPEVGDECGRTVGANTEPDECKTAPNDDVMGDECDPDGSGDVDQV